MKKCSLLIILSVLVFLHPATATWKHRKLKIVTPYGAMIVLLSDETPQYRDNIIRLVKARFYNGLLFHRVIRHFMIQGGDPDSRHAKPGMLLGNGGVGYTLPAAFRPDLFHCKGALAAARDDNPLKASSGCQFYIVEGRPYTDQQLDQLEKSMHRKIPAAQRMVYKTLGGTPWLDQNYTVFGQVIRGMNVIDRIAAVATDKSDRPIKDIPMKIRLIHKFLFF
ncbi:MAG TPA: peptidylprolyl isomerase [Chitinophagaceae bacterium]|nr:peptidylprolyl isomerase [Chitinophagaceae bacterium]